MNVCLSKSTAVCTLQGGFVVSLCCLLVLSGCAKSVTSDAAAADPSAGDQSAGPPPALVQVEPAKRQDIRPKLLAVGTVRARHTSIVASASDGIVATYAVEQGDFVRENAVLSELRMQSTELDLEAERALLAEREAEYQEILSPRPEDVDEARAQLQSAEIAQSHARRRFEELRSLGQRGAANESAVRDAEDVFEEHSQLVMAAKAVFARVSSGVREEQKLQVKARRDSQINRVAFLESERDKRITLAPFAGFVVGEHSYVGEWLSKGAPVVTLADLSEVDVEVQIDQSFISQVRSGDAVEVRVPGTRNPRTSTDWWSGTVDAIVVRSDWQSGSRSFPVIVRIQNQLLAAADAADSTNSRMVLPVLREGMMAEVHFLGESVDALLVPKDALVRSNRSVFVYAVDPPAAGAEPVARQISVEPGLSEGGWIQVTCEGLQPGTSVVTVGGERLRPFQTVMIQQGERAAVPSSENPRDRKTQDTTTTHTPTSDSPTKNDPGSEATTSEPSAEETSTGRASARDTNTGRASAGDTEVQR